MEISAEALREELKTLRKGRGVHTPRIDEQIGPQLRAVCEIDPTDGPGVIRDKLISRLGALAKSLPDDYALAVTAALGIHPDAQDPFLNLRIEWVARRIQRDDRTARRRVDDAINRLAEAAARKAAAPTAAVAEVKRDLWYTEESTVGLRLDGTEPLMIERRLMVAESDDIRQLELGVTIPRGEDGRMAYEPNIEVLYGGTLIERPVGNYSQFKFALQLPKPLMRGDRHDYALITKVPPTRRMRPHFVLVSPRRCDLFDLHVRFDTKNLPESAWIMRDVFHRAIDERTPSDELRQPDDAGELHEVFTDLKPGFGYGFQWTDLPE